jgi:hypothetical protein
MVTSFIFGGSSSNYGNAVFQKYLLENGKRPYAVLPPKRSGEFV